MTHRGEVINDLFDLVERHQCLVDRPDAKHLVRSALETAYYDGRLDEILESKNLLAKSPRID